MLLIVLCVSLTGVLSYWYLSRRFTADIARYNGLLLTQIQSSIDESFFRKADLTAIDLLLNDPRNEVVHFFLSHPTQGNHVQILRTLSELRSRSVTDDDVVESLAVFYRDNGIVISSAFGVVFLGSDYQVYIIPRGGTPQSIGVGIWRELRDVVG